MCKWHWYPAGIQLLSVTKYSILKGPVTSFKSPATLLQNLQKLKKRKTPPLLSPPPQAPELQTTKGAPITRGRGFLTARFQGLIYFYLPNIKQVLDKFCSRENLFTRHGTSLNCLEVTSLAIIIRSCGCQAIWRQESLYMAVIVLIQNRSRGEENCSRLVEMAT